MLMSFRQYASHRGVSVEAVSKAVRRGRISTTPDAKGTRKIDPAVADREWTANSDPSKVRDQAPPAEASEEDLRTEEEDREAESVRKQSATLHKSKAMIAAYQAQIAKLEFEERLKRVVSTAEVEERWATIAGIVRTKVLGIPSKARQRCPDLTVEQYAALELICREALEELSDE